MKYTNNDHIASADEVKAFASNLVNDLGVNLHPDNDFAEYVCYETGVYIYELLLPILQNYVSNGDCDE